MGLVGKFVVALGVLALSACAAQKTEPAVETSDNAGLQTPAAAPSPVAVNAPPKPSPRPAGHPRSVEPGVTSGQGSTSEPAENVAALPPRDIRVFPDLIGLTGPEVQRAMGAPDRIGDQPPAEVWHYVLSGCELALFLYPDVASGAPKALTYSAAERPVASSQSPDPRCSEVAANG